MAVWPPDNVLGATVEPPAPVLFVLSTIAIFCLTCLHPFRKKAIVEHVIVVAVAFAVVDVVTDGSRGWCSGVARSWLWLLHGHCLFTRLPLLVVGLAGCGRGVRIVRACVCG